MDDGSVQCHDDRRERIWVRRGICRPCGRPSRSCPIGSLRPGTTPCVADNRPASGSPPATPPSKPRPTAKIRPVCPIPLPCADGHNGDCSACAAGSRSEPGASAFCEHPPSLPGIWARSAVFCPSRQEVRESNGSRRTETADSAAGVSASSRLATGPAISASAA
jgi:hypothetical protein